MKVKLLIILLLLITSCDKNRKVLGFDKFSLTVPDTWEKVKLNGFDSYVGGIITETQDTLIFDYGLYSEDITMNDRIFVFDSTEFKEMSEKEVFEKTKDVYVVVPSEVEKRNLEEEYEKKDKHIYEFKNIDCFQAKIIKPKVSGVGRTGIFIESLNRSVSQDKDNSVKFSFYGYNLDSITQSTFLNSIKTIKFKNCNEH